MIFQQSPNPEPASYRTLKWTILGLSLIFGGILAIRAAHFFPYFADDALISLRYAHRLLHGHGLTWTEGIRVEGYSNLLWILLSAFLGDFGIDLVVAVRLLGFVCIITVFATISYAYLRNSSFRAIWLPLAATLLFLSLNSSLAVWSIAGLETPLVAALLAVSVAQMISILETDSSKERLLLSFTLALLCITRPDGPMFTVACLFMLAGIDWLRSGNPLKAKTLVLLVFPSIFTASQLIFRILYYREFLPNIALVKIAPSKLHALSGWWYLRDGLSAMSPFSILALLSLGSMLFIPQTRRKGSFLLLLTILWSGYLIFIGGDVFPAYRQLMPLIVVFGFALLEGGLLWMRVLEQLTFPPLRYATGFLALLLLVPYIRNQYDDQEFKNAVKEQWEWRGKELGLILKKVFGAQQPLIAVTDAGAIPYWSELPALDMLGLNDYYLPRHPPKDFGERTIGHELGDGAYVLSRNPDLIIFHMGTGPLHRWGQEMNEIPAFNKDYVLVSIRLPVTSLVPSRVYVNRFSAKIGIKRSADSIEIPGFLFTGKHAFATLSSSDQLVTSLSTGDTIRVTLDSLEVDRWSVGVKASEPGIIRTDVHEQNGVSTILLTSRINSPVEIEEVVLTPKKQKRQ